MREEVLSFMQLFEGLRNANSTSDIDSYDIAPYEFDALPYIVSTPSTFIFFLGAMHCVGVWTKCKRNENYFENSGLLHTSIHHQLEITMTFN